jgi:hypothetical protein
MIFLVSKERKQQPANTSSVYAEEEEEEENIRVAKCQPVQIVLRQGECGLGEGQPPF